MQTSLAARQFLLRTPARSTVRPQHFRRHASATAAGSSAKASGSRQRKLALPLSVLLVGGSGAAAYLLSHPPDDPPELSAVTVHGDPLEVLAPSSLNASTLHYRRATGSSLLCSWAVYTACGLPWLIDAAPALLGAMDSFKRNVPVLGDAAFYVMKVFLRATFFGKFVAGEDVAGTKRTLEQVSSLGAGGFLSYSAESEESPEGAVIDDPLHEDIETNMEAIQLAAQHPAGRPTGPELKPTWVALKLTGFLKDPTVFARASEALESSSGFQRGTLLPSASDPFPSSLMLSDSDKHALDSLTNELRRMLTFAKSNGVRVDVDAEQSWFQTGLDQLVHSLQLEFNTDKTIVYNTYQCYRKDALDRLTATHQLMKDNGAAYGAKLVRGAYMVAERKRAKELGRESPVWDDKPGTDKCFNDCAAYMVEAVAEDLRLAANDPSAAPRAGVMLGSHNPYSVRLVLSNLRERGIIRNREGGKVEMSNEVRRRVAFGQLYSMSDAMTTAITSTLVLPEGEQEELSPVLKWLVFGSIEQTLPYLIRRAQENKAVLSGSGDNESGGATVERKAAGKEILRRLRLA